MELLAWGANGWGDELIEGAWLTCRLAVAALAFGLIFGLLGAGAQLARSRSWRAIGRGYTMVVRGVPELLIILVVYFGSGFFWQWLLGLFGGEAQVEVSAFAAGVFALSLVFGAFAAEVWRAAFLAIPNGQIEAAQALGLRRMWILWRIQLPQAARFALPGLGNLWLVLLKDTSLVSIIALNELTRMTNIAVGATKQPFTFYLAASLIYLGLTGASTLLLRLAERRADLGVRRV
jgi:polar amino acid transport system permease protein